MRIVRVINLVLFLVCIVANCSENKQSPAGYDPTRDPFKDLNNAIGMAQTSNQRILLEVGGEWCKWCHILENFLKENKEVRDLLYSNFIVLKINFSKENKNIEFLSRYPEIPGYPHFFVLDSDGTFLHSQGTEVFETGKRYDSHKLINFMYQWASPDQSKN